MRHVLLVLLFEWPVFLVLAWYFEQVSANRVIIRNSDGFKVVQGTGAKRHPLFFLGYIQKSKQSVANTPGKQTSLPGRTDVQGEAPAMTPLIGSSSTSIQIADETEEVAAERQRVENMTEEEAARHSIILRNLRKVFPSVEGLPEKVAVRNLSLAVERGEVFGLLGPNGAGKTTTINMLIGFISATSGEAYIEGLDINRDMKTLYTMMGVCPQHDLLWETLTGFEHMLFYGRLKGLKNSELQQAAEDALKAVNLFHGGVSKLQVKKYSGGMKRRLSVAISFIGSPRVVYLDEPSTGLDPASRRNLWKVVKQAKQDKAIILTTHNMEEAEVLCDRLGIFVDGRLEVIGNPKSLTQRYGGYLVFTLNTAPVFVERAAVLVRERFPNAVESYRLSGTVKYELPLSDVGASEVFRFVDALHGSIEVQDWGVTTVTLEEVFIKIAKQGGAKALELPS